MVYPSPPVAATGIPGRFIDLVDCPPVAALTADRADCDYDYDYDYHDWSYRLPQPYLGCRHNLWGRQWQTERESIIRRTNPRLVRVRQSGSLY